MYEAVCWDPYTEGQISGLMRVQKRAVKFANKEKESGLETLAQRRMISGICAHFKSYTAGRDWTAIRG